MATINTYVPGKLSPRQGWEVWKSDSINAPARFPATDAGRDRVIAYAVKLADKTEVTQ